MGRPSFTLKTVFTFRPAAFSAEAVPRVAARSKPSAANLFASSTASGLCRSLTLKKMQPFAGSGTPALSCALPKASPKFSPTPITSPVERISGPSAGSTPGNLLNGNTGLFTHTCFTGSTPS